MKPIYILGYKMKAPRKTTCSIAAALTQEVC